MWTTPATMGSSSTAALTQAPPPPPAPAAPDYNATGGVNASGYLVDDEPEEIGLSELQTVALACVATLIPLALGLLAVCGLRLAWRRWRGGVGVGGGVDGRPLRRADGSDPSRSGHLLLPDEIKTSESQFSVIPVEELDEAMSVGGMYGGGCDLGGRPVGLNHSHHHTTKSTATANGSVITMTMQNNHLIVETEEPAPYVESAVGLAESRIEERVERAASPRLPPPEAGAAAGGGGGGGGGGPATGLSQGDRVGYRYGNQTEYGEDEDRDDDCDRDTHTQTIESSTRRSKPTATFVAQPSQDVDPDMDVVNVVNVNAVVNVNTDSVVDGDELYLEQQRQLGNGLDDRTPPPPTAFQ